MKKFNLTDFYIRRMLCNGNSLSHQDIPNELVNLKREIVILKQKINQFNNG